MVTDAAPPSTPPAAAPHLCPNCGAVAPGTYCPHCGQETSLALPTVRALLREAAGRYVALDGRMWRTLIAMRFLDPQQPKRLLARLRRLFARARLEKEEVNILRGILARIDQLLARRA